ncbi:hypothetical protein [Methylotenera sp. 1P/1]|uniref:hypothetical protein n=1 Tax=Methylotenera sp. 1P/1 TaxID=1131551 RepID=UPI00035C266D|nr:hypothetical protein [Methylotenera sp. 1P/1]
MRVLVIGAGASIEEARRSNVPEEYWPPVMNNFAEKLWNNHSGFFNYWLPDYLSSLGYDAVSDPTDYFIELSKRSPESINIERLFEFCWNNKGKKFPEDWQNLIYHGILNPLSFLLIMGFFNEGQLIELKAGGIVTRKLSDGDIVLSLNYETLFELAAEQSARKITYSPNIFNGQGLLIVKPHGSMNLLANEHRFKFCDLNCIGSVHSSLDDYRNWTAIIPPRFNKQYEQHPIARMIINPISNIKPDVLTFWGVGLTDSDIDLVQIYKQWIGSATRIEVINPDRVVESRIQEVLNSEVIYYATLDEWALAS